MMNLLRLKKLLPENYINFIEGNDSYEVEIQELCFQLYCAEELLEEITIDGQPLKRIHQLKGFIDTIFEVNSDFFDENDVQFYQDALKLLTVGYCNTTLLCVDNDNSLFLFYTDGGDIEPIQSVNLLHLIKE